MDKGEKRRARGTPAPCGASGAQPQHNFAFICLSVHKKDDTKMCAFSDMLKRHVTGVKRSTSNNHQVSNTCYTVLQKVGFTSKNG